MTTKEPSPLTVQQQSGQRRFSFDSALISKLQLLIV